MASSRIVAALACAAISVGLYSGAAAQAVVVGAKEFTEQLLVAEMTVQLLQASGLSTHKGTGFATTGVRTLQERGIIDVYWEYTGTSLATFNQVTEKLSPDEAYARVKALDAQRGLVWLAPSKVNNTYALAMRRGDATAKGISSISDLASKVRAGEEMRLASTVEFVTRADGVKPLERTYGFQFGDGNVVAMDTGAIYRALRRSSEFEVGVVFATDARVSGFDLAVLRDDRGFFPSYILAPVVRKTTLDRVPDMKTPLEKLATQLDNDTMAALNAAVDLHGRRVEEIASEFLRIRALLSGPKAGAYWSSPARSKRPSSRRRLCKAISVGQGFRVP
jgi:osmoprotectant transport system substrate-binding protein